MKLREINIPLPLRELPEGIQAAIFADSEEALVSVDCVLSVTLIDGKLPAAAKFKIGDNHVLRIGDRLAKIEGAEWTKPLWKGMR